jgi:FAD/FMN-containing dehydrogenase
MRRMDSVSVHEAFTPASSRAAPAPAVSVGAGGMWLHAYQAVTGGAGRYVQGGGCTTVGVAGLVQGGGFGSFSKRYGLAAASLIEAAVVTADGVTRVVNEDREPDLFWALKGGGGGTFGIITRLTLATHPLPQTLGAVSLTLRARSDEAYPGLLERFLELYARALFNPHWSAMQYASGPRACYCSA